MKVLREFESRTFRHIRGRRVNNDRIRPSWNVTQVAEGTDLESQQSKGSQVRILYIPPSYGSTVVVAYA